MTKAEYISLCSQRWDMIKNLEESTNFYNHEKDFDNIWTEMGRAVLEKSVSEVPKDYRKKSLSRPSMEKLKFQNKATITVIKKDRR